MGPVMVRHLIDAGFEVRAISRSSSAPDTLPRSVEYWSGDICDRDFLRRAVKGVNLVFHLAARLHITNPGAELRADYRRVNVEGTRNVVDACLAEEVRRLVYFSTINVYGPTPGKYVDEDTPPHPEGIYGETKLAAEELVLAAKGSPSGEALGVVLRMAAIYGPRMKGNYPRLVKALSRGVFLPVGNGRNRRTLVYEQDAVRAALLAAQHPLAPGRIYNVSDGEIYILRDIIAAICAAIERRPSRFYLPVRPVRPLARVADGLAGLARRSLNLTAMVDKFVADIAVRAERIKRELAFQPLYGLQDGWKQAIAAWQKGEGF
jgi:UDP-glucose 4-epimerase